MTPLAQANANIIYDTADSALVQTMAMVADAGADAGAAADAASGRSSTSSRHSAHSPASPLSPSSIASSSSSSTSTTHRTTHTHTTATATGTTTIASSGATNNPAPLTFSGRPPSNRPSIEIPQPQSPITLHHALDGTFPSSATAQKSSATPTRILPRSIESCVQDTLAKDPSQQYGSSSYSGSGSNGQRRIMTPTSRLAETAVGVREVSKKIGKYSLSSPTTPSPFYFPLVIIFVVLTSERKEKKQKEGLCLCKRMNATESPACAFVCRCIATSLFLPSLSLYFESRCTWA